MKGHRHPALPNGSWLLLAGAVLGAIRALPSAGPDRGTTDTGPQDTSQASPWRLQQISPADRGTLGARWPELSEGWASLVYIHDGDLPSQAGPGNPDGNPEVWAWSGVFVGQLTATSRAGGSTPVQSRPSASALGAQVAFLSSADLNGGNPDGSREVWVWDFNLGFIQITASDTGAADGPVISASGEWVAFWYVGNLTGANPDGGLELYVAKVGGPIRQLTNLSGSPYHDLPSISEDGSEVAFIVQADISGQNPDDSWELFLWSGPWTAPGDAARFRQVTDWGPPMTGREIYHPTLSGRGNSIAFAGRGQVDVRLAESHTELEIYLWSEPDRLERLTRATSGGSSSLLPQLSRDGTHIAFVSLSDFAPGAPGNPERNQELFVWSMCGPVAQLTAGRDRGGIVANIPEVAPPIDARGTISAFVSETVDYPHPLALTSRLGILFRAVEGPTTLCRPPVVATPTAGASQPATSTPPASPTPTQPVGGLPRLCPQVAARIPSVVQARALVEPEAFYGWDLPANPALPPGRWNPPRRWLSIRDPGKPYSPVNGAVWKAGCP